MCFYIEIYIVRGFQDLGWGSAKAMKQEYAMAYAAGAGLWLVMMVQHPSPEESLW